MKASWSRVWSHVPIPEAHVLGLSIAEVLQRRYPYRLVPNGPLTRLGGVSCLFLGMGLITWATNTFTRTLDGEDELVTDGPYRHSRNPMYLGWTALYLGVGLLRNSLWFILTLPAVLAITHRTVRAEERTLERGFPEGFADYRERVPRYLGIRSLKRR